MKANWPPANPALSGCHFPAVTVISHMAVVSPMIGSKLVCPLARQQYSFNRLCIQFIQGNEHAAMASFDSHLLTSLHLGLEVSLH